MVVCGSSATRSVGSVEEMSVGDRVKKKRASRCFCLEDEVDDNEKDSEC